MKKDSLRKKILIAILLAMAFVCCISVQNCRLQIRGRCYICQPKYNLDRLKNLCIKIQEQLDPRYIPPQINTTAPGTPTVPVQSLNQRSTPCNGKDFCGEVQTFTSQNLLISNLKKRQSDTQIKSVLPRNVGQPTILQSASFQSTARSSAANNLDFSETNNQVSSVDQADIIKTDGEYIYSVSRCTLSIIKSFPYNQASVVSTINFPQQPQGLFIEGKYLTVFGTSYSPSVHTFIYIYDVSNRARPRIQRSFTISGSYLQARKAKVSGYMYLLAIQYLDLNDPQLPIFNTGYGNQEVDIDDIFVYPDAENSFVFINIVSINLRNPLSNNSFAVVSLVTERGYIIYVSDYNIYITFTKYEQSSLNFRSVPYTVIHVVYINRQLMIPYADAKVQGYITNQFFMDQYNFDLRIATTQNNVQTQLQPIANLRIPIPETSNNVFVLRYNAFQGKLQVIGQIRNIAPSERIYSCRFVQTKLYMVTFRRVDPFFVINLSNPTNPEILGQLKIPGFSTYLHPFDQTTIIGIGRDATDQGITLGLKIALFDVSNVANPTQLASFQLQEKYASSAAEYEHKAFLFDRQKELLVIPASFYDAQNNHTDTFNGAFVFRITRTQIYNPVIVDHLNNDSGTENFYKRYVERSLYVENVLFTKSPCKLRLHLLPSVLAIKDINLACCENPPPATQIGGFIRN